MKLADLTTLRVGGEADRVLAPATRDELIDCVLGAWRGGEPVLLLGGGSNVLIGDGDFDGTVVRVVTRGIEAIDVDDDGAVLLRVQAGESWDGLVALAVSRGWAGIEALSGIPGSCGASPIQNIGAYGQEIASSLVAVEFLDYLTGEVETIAAADLGLGYRTSALKEGREGLVVSIDIRLRADAAGLSDPVRYAQLAGALGVELGVRVPLAELRDTVLALRSSKGMVLDPADPDSASAGSFFTNPIVGQDFAATLPADAPRWPMAPDAEDLVLPLPELAAGYNTDPVLPQEVSDPRRHGATGSGSGGAAASRSPRVKLSAAWLIEHSGIRRGFRLPGSRAAVSSKHTLALINTGGATAADVSELARYIQTRVMAEFGVRLHPEPVLVGVQF